MRLSSKLKVLGLCLVGLVPLLSGLAYGAPGDWPQWRGPNRDGCSADTGLQKEWPAGGPPLAWKATGLGDGYACVAVVGERIYTAGERGDSSFVLALNRADGKPVWSAKLGKAGAPGDPKFEGPRGTPTLDGDLVFAVGQWGDMVCLESATGKEKWRKAFTADFGGRQPNWGYSESPLVDGNKVLVTPGGDQGSVVALDRVSGAVVWRSKDFKDNPHYSSLIIAENGGVRQYIQLTPASVAGIASQDGALLWRAPRRGDVAVIPTPIYHDGFVYVTSGYGAGCSLFQIAAAAGSFKATQVYANKVVVNHHGGAILVGDCVYSYSDGKGWTCQDFKTGVAKWQEKEKLGKGSLVYADGHFYLRQEGGKGTVVLIEATPAGYKEHGRFDQPGRSDKSSWPHPVVTGGRLYLRDQDVLLCYDVKARPPA